MKKIFYIFTVLFVTVVYSSENESQKYLNTVKNNTDTMQKYGLYDPRGNLQSSFELAPGEEKSIRTNYLISRIQTKEELDNKKTTSSDCSIS